MTSEGYTRPQPKNGANHFCAARACPKIKLFRPVFRGENPIIMAKKLVATRSQTSSVPGASPSVEAATDLLQPDLKDLPAAPIVARPKCIQCGKTIRTMPFFPGNITCRDCYGAERYSRGPGVPIGASSLSAPVIDKTYTA